jgi:hypothetical protein
MLSRITLIAVRTALGVAGMDVRQEPASSPARPAKRLEHVAKRLNEKRMSMKGEKMQLNELIFVPLIVVACLISATIPIGRKWEKWFLPLPRTMESAETQKVPP